VNSPHKIWREIRFIYRILYLWVHNYKLKIKIRIRIIRINNNKLMEVQVIFKIVGVTRIRIIEMDLKIV
jgi:hypothetical protein